MALVPVINNHTGDEGKVDEIWLERWPEDFTEPSADHVPLSEQAAATLDPASEPPTQEAPPSDGTTNEEI